MHVHVQVHVRVRVRVSNMHAASAEQVDATVEAQTFGVLRCGLERSTASGFLETFEGVLPEGVHAFFGVVWGA